MRRGLCTQLSDSIAKLQVGCVIARFTNRQSNIQNPLFIPNAKITHFDY
jgi:hypothetical protein